MARKIVAGNWKMNLNRDEAFALVSEITGMLKDEESRDLKVILFPSFIHLGGIVQLCLGDSRIHIGAQNCNDHSAGAFTGEISATIAKGFFFFFKFIYLYPINLYCKNTYIKILGLIGQLLVTPKEGLYVKKLMKM